MHRKAKNILEASFFDHEEFQHVPFSLREFIIFLVFLIRVEVEDALNEVLGEHERALLKQQINQAIFTETNNKKQIH